MCVSMCVCVCESLCECIGVSELVCLIHSFKTLRPFSFSCSDSSLFAARTMCWSPCACVLCRLYKPRPQSTHGLFVWMGFCTNERACTASLIPTPTPTHTHTRTPTHTPHAHMLTHTHAHPHAHPHTPTRTPTHPLAHSCPKSSHACIGE